MFPFLQNSGSGGGPQTSGFNPTPAEALMQMQGQSSHLQMIQRAAMMQPRAQLAASVLANNVLFPGDPQTARRWMEETQEGQVSQQLAAMIASTGVMGLGRSGDMLHGIQNMVANSGARMGIEGVTGAQQFYGSGFLTDQFSAQLMSKMTSDFYSMGRANFQSRGLDMTDVGQIMNSAGARGVFAGRQLYEMEAYTEKTLKEDITKAYEQGDVMQAQALERANPGDMRLRLNDQADKVKSFVQDTGDLLGDLKDLYGSLPVEELLQRAEAITGMGVEEMGGVSAIRSRINQVTSMAQAYGLNPQAVLESQVQLSQGIGMQMSSMYGASPDMYRRTSSVLGQAGIETMMAARQGGMESAGLLGEHGIYQRQFSDEYRSSVSGQSSLAVMSQEYAAIEALYAADQAGTSHADKTELRAAVEQLRGASTEDQRSAARDRINSAMKNSGWGPSGTLTGRYNGDLSRMTERMSQGALQDVTSLVTGVDRNSTLEYQTMDALHNMQIFDRYKSMTDAVGSGTAAGVFRDMIDNFDPATLNSILKTDSEKDAIDQMVAAGMNPEEAAALARNISTMEKNGDFDTAFREFQAEFRSNPMNANFSSRMTQRAGQDRAYQQQAINNSLGRSRLSKQGLIDVGLAALAGMGDGATEGNILAYLADNEGGMSIGKNKDGGLDVNTNKAKAMLDELTGGDANKAKEVLAKMGVSDLDGFVKSVQTKEGFQKFHRNIMGDSRLHGEHTKDGFFVASDKSVNATATLMDGEAAKALFQTLGLGDLDSDKREAIMGGDYMELSSRLVDEDTGLFNKKGSKLLSNYLRGGDESKSAAAALRYYGRFDSNPILQGLDEREAELMKEREGASDKAKGGIDAELRRVKEMRENLGGGGEGKKFLGVMTLKMDNEAEVNIFT